VAGPFAICLCDSIAKSPLNHKEHKEIQEKHPRLSAFIRVHQWLQWLFAVNSLYHAKNGKDTRMRLREKVALITGAGSGIGRESALLFAQEGAAVVVVDVNVSGGEETVAQVSAQGGRAIFVKADVSKDAECRAMVAAAEDEFGCTCSLTTPGLCTPPMTTL
jgi:hypothetical protein